MTSPDARRSRVSVTVLFVALGAVQGSWAARIPDVRAQIAGMTDAHWGVANIGSPAGSVAALGLMLAIISRMGPRRLTRTAAVLVLLNAPLLAGASNAVWLIGCLAVQGFASNLLATSMNAQAVHVERDYGRRIMSGFHATYSLGQLGGGIAGTLGANAGLSPSAQLAITGTALAVPLALTQPAAPRDTDLPPKHARGPSLRHRLSRQLALLAVLALLSAICEGTAVQWSAIYTADSLRAGAAAGAATFSCFSIAMTVSRLVGDRVVHRIGQRAFLMSSGLISSVGITVAIVGATPAAAFIGFAILGVGSACVVPTVYGLAGNQPGLSAGEGVSVAALGMWPAFLLGPPVIGFLAGGIGLRWALSLLAIAGVLISVCGSRARVPATMTGAGNSPSDAEVTPEPAASAARAAVAAAPDRT